MGLGAFAQERVAKKALPTPVKQTVKHEVLGTDVVEGTTTSNFELRGTQSVVTNEAEYYYEAEAMYTTYDLQSNSYLANRMYQLKDGSVIPINVGISAGSRNDYLYEKLDLLISGILSKGYDIVPVSVLSK